jgi:hypothetical protein
MRRPKTVRGAESWVAFVCPHHFMRDLLHSEMANVHGIPNLPDDPDLAIVEPPRPRDSNQMVSASS